MAVEPDIRIIAMAPAPEGVASATIESLYNIFFVLGCKVTKSKLVLILKLFELNIYYKKQCKYLTVITL